MEVLGIAKNNDNMLINDQIKAREVLVIGPNGEQVGVKQLQDALTLASYAALDLVLISPNGNPPVCKVMDYNKYRYERQKKLKEAQKNKYFWIMGIGLLFVGIYVSAYSIQYAAYFQGELQLSSSTIATTGSLFAMASLLGSMVGGILFDKLGVSI